MKKKNIHTPGPSREGNKIVSFTADLAVTESAVYVFESEHDKKANAVTDKSKPTTKIKPNKDKDPKNERGWMQWGTGDN